jgi:ATP/maltotriose-dependent transcriptional regulator MalT
MTTTFPLELLERADLDRETGADGRAGAMDVYCRYAAHIDPATPEGAARVRWMLDLGRPLPFEVEPLMERASERAASEMLRASASLATAHFAVRTSKFERAESILRRVLAEVRGTGATLEHAACLHLSSAFRAQRREFEALVMARRAAALAKVAGDPANVATALLHLGATLTEIGEWAAFDAVAAEIEELAQSVPPVRLEAIARNLHRYRAEALLERRDLAAARREIDAYAAHRTDAWLRESAVSGGLMLRARCDLAAGNVEGALTTTERLLAGMDEASGDWFSCSAMLVNCLARVVPARAAAAARPVLRLLETHGTRAVGTGGVLRAAASIGQALEPVEGAGDEALFAYEIAAAAMFERTAELHVCLRDIDELSSAIADDREMLARFGRRYVDEHEAMLAAIARLHEAGVVAEPLRLARLVAADGVVRVCAWCLCVRAGDGTQLPVGHFLPDSTRFRVTHGICPECVTRYGNR